MRTPARTIDQGHSFGPVDWRWAIPSYTPSVIMTKKTLEVAGTEPEGTKPTHDASRRPVWSMKLNRVDCAVWANDKDGQTRYSVAIYREYFDQREKQPKRGHYFDKADLADVIALATTALQKVESLLLPERVGNEVD